jgi:glutamate racemase
MPPLAPVVSRDRALPVAVFDSGVGGLTVLHECLVSLPHEDFVYLGDTARFPYGDRSPEELLAFARELAGILLDRRAKLLVVACNSATAAALPALRDDLRGRPPVVGVVRPESRLAAAATRNGRVGLIATPATVGSGAYERALAAEAPAAELHAVASAELATLIQEGGEVDHRVVTCVDGLCRPLRAAGVDTVILGCTHYPLVRHVLQRALGRSVAIVSSGQAIADEVEAQLREADLENDDRRRGDYHFLATGEPEDFRRLGTRFLQLPIGQVEHVAVSLPRADHRTRDAEAVDVPIDGSTGRRGAPRVSGDPDAARSLV